ncbi:MAG: hypothetical protein ACRCSN_19670 [Dermatophilaceae bacterium]
MAFSPPLWRFTPPRRKKRAYLQFNDAAKVATASLLGEPAAGSVTVALGLATSPEAARPLTATSAVTVTLGRSDSPEAARPAGPVKTVTLGLAVSSDTAFAVTIPPPSLTRVLGLATETSVAQPLTEAKSDQLGQAAEADAAFGPVRAKTVTLGLATQVELAQSLVLGGSTARTLGLATEASVAQALVELKARGVGSASEADVATGAPLRAKQVTLGLSVSPHSAQPLTVSSVAPTVVALGRASEVNAARVLTVLRTEQFWTFTPPAYGEKFTSNPLWRRMPITLGQAVVLYDDGRVKTEDWAPTTDHPGVESVYPGGRAYRIPRPVRDRLVAAGYGSNITN